MDDLISRQAAIEVIDAAFPVDPMKSEYTQGLACGAALAKTYVEQLPSAQPEQTDCEYCHEDSEGYVRSIEKNSHAWIVRRGRSMKLRIGLKGEYRECDILYCPMCGRRLTYG